MKYAKEFKEECIELLNSGVNITSLHKQSKVSRVTLTKWVKEFKAKNINIENSINILKQKIENLSKKEEQSKDDLIMLSELITALNKLENGIKKQNIIRTKIKPIINMSGDYETLKKKALEEGGLYDYQKKFLNDNSQFRIVLKARQIGFSYVSGLDALLGAVGGRNQLFLSASEEQARILMNYLYLWAKSLGISFNKDTEYEKSLDNGAYIRVMAHNFRTVQGFSGDIWMDEFAWYPNPKKIWHSFVPSIGAIKGRLTILSTPFEQNSLFHELITDELKYYVFSRHSINIYKAMEDGLNFDLETMKTLFDADTWASAYECQFIDDENALLSINLIKSCVKDYRVSNIDKNIPQYAGFDIGRSKDRSVLISIFDKEGIKYLSCLDVFAKASFESQEYALSNFLKLNPLALLKIDKTGIGMATAEKLKSMFKSRAQGVYFTAPTKENLALNLKKHFEDGLIYIPNDPALISDLHAIKRKAGTKSFLYDSNANEHGHADRFWALALALSYFERIRVRKNGRAIII